MFFFFFFFIIIIIIIIISVGYLLWLPWQLKLSTDL